MIRKAVHFLIFGIIFIAGSGAYNFAQAQKNLSSINVDDLNDTQIQQFIAQVQAGGLPLSQIGQVAHARGMSQVQIAKLKARVEKLGAGDKDAHTIKDVRNNSRRNNAGINPMLDKNYEQDSIKHIEFLSNQSLDLLKSKIFGSDLFNNSNISFEPNLRLATPQDYQIGPDDEILIDIYGDSEASYTLKVSPEGKINIPYIGPVSIANMSIAQATQRIKNKLQSTYHAMASGNTKVEVSLGNIRSIKVILTGEVTRPGTYTLSSFATVMNALYSAGGPTENGSYRKISVIRGGKTVSTIDIYDFLMTGDLGNNIRLQDGDVIRIPTYSNRVELIGEVKRPGIFETLHNETFNDALNFAGGFNEVAYKARVKVLQNTDTERKIQDVTVDQFDKYHPMAGDKIYIDQILDRFANRVTIEGAVFRPGVYSLDENPTLKILLQKAEGLKEDAYMDRGYILRKKDNSESELVSFDLKSVLNGSEDIALRKEDNIHLKSIYDLRENYKVKIVGQVRNPGEFNYSENMTLNDLILRAGGFKDNALKKRIEIAHRVRSAGTATNNTIAKIIEVDFDQGINLSDKSYLIEPFDIVSVRLSPSYEIQRQVLIEGEVKYPGYYTITSKDERISDLIKRAGGLSQWAYVQGASLKRMMPGSNLNDTSLLTREKERVKLLQFKKLQRDVNDTTDIDLTNESVRNDFVGINLDYILRKPGSKQDIYLQDGDIINIPIEYQTVTVSGEILSPSKVIYSNNKSLKFYINSAGGFSTNADKRKVYINYANGGVMGTRKFIFFRSYPRVKPGAEIFVPKRPEKRRLGTGEIAGLSTAFASIAAILISVLRR